MKVEFEDSQGVEGWASLKVSFLIFYVLKPDGEMCDTGPNMRQHGRKLHTHSLDLCV